MLVVAVALELQDAVDEVLEDTRPGDGAVLRDVADEDGRDAGLLRDAQKPSRGLAHLCDRAGSRAERRDAWSVWTESMTQTSGRSASSVAHTTSSSVSARISTVSAPPSRAARSETCAADSSPVTRSARRPLRAIAPSALSRSVDFPTPGSPPTRTSEAGTRPPPRTRSSSDTPVEMRSASSTETSPIGTGCAGRADAVSVAEPWSSSTRVPKAPQPGHFPSQRPDVVPQSAQVNWTVTFATGLPV